MRPCILPGRSTRVQPQLLENRRSESNPPKSLTRLGIVGLVGWQEGGWSASFHGHAIALNLNPKVYKPTTLKPSKHKPQSSRPQTRIRP